MAEPVTDADGLGEILRGLLDSWGAARGQVALAQKGRRANASRFISIHSLAAHVHRLCSAGLILIEDQRNLEAMPVVRAAYESAITAVWLAQNEDGANALFNEFTRQQRAISMSLAKSRNPTFASGLDLPYTDTDELDTDSNAQARWFEKLCTDFNDGADLYIYYRQMSGYSHAGLRVIEEYIRPTEDRTDVQSLLKVSQFGPMDMWLFFLTASAIWAGSAFDYIDKDRARRSELRQAARDIGVVRDLKLTSDAERRTARRKRKRMGSKKAST